MAAIAFPNHTKSLTLSTRHTYSYVHIPAKHHSKSTILFLHGFPSSSYDWRHQIEFFAETGHGILAPDLLGFGGTSKPSSADSYKAKCMAAEIVEIMDNEGLQRVHGVSHDTGSILLSRLPNYFPDRVLSTTFLAVPYSKPGQHFDLEAVNAMTKQLLGKERFGYLSFFTSDYAGAMLDQYSDSFFSLFYPKKPDLWTDHIGPPGAIEKWLRADRRGDPAPYITDEERTVHQRIMVGNHTPALNWYRALVWNLNEKDELEASLPIKLPSPVLMVLPPVLATQFQGAGLTGANEIADDLTVKSAGVPGHWIQLEARDEINFILREFFERVDGEVSGDASSASNTKE